MNRRAETRTDGWFDHRVRAVLIGAAYAVIFLPIFVDALRSSPLATYGDWANALVVVVAFIALPLVTLTAYYRGAFRSSAREYLEDGYVSTTVSRSAPQIVPVAIGITFLVITAPLVIAAVVGLAGEAGALFSGAGAPPIFLALAGLFFLPVLIWPAILGYLVLRFVVDRRIARLIARCHGSSGRERDSGSSEATAARPLPGSATTRRIAFAHALHPAAPAKVPVDERRNVLGRSPIRTLYLWNFDVGEPRPDIRSWREYGPVFWLASPRDIPLLGYLDLTLIRSPEDHFAATRDDVDRWLARPSAPDRRRRPWRRYGRFPDHSLPCFDAAWRSAVEAACRFVDIVILDARGLTPERAGLSWEIAHIVSSLPPERYVILADLTSDVRLLTEEILRSLPRGPGSGPVRVVYPPLAHSRTEIVEALKDSESRAGSGLIRSSFPADELIPLFADVPTVAGKDVEWSGLERLHDHLGSEGA